MAMMGFVLVEGTAQQLESDNTRAETTVLSAKVDALNRQLVELRRDLDESEARYEAVAKAVMSAFPKWIKYLRGFLRAKIKRMQGRISAPWINSPETTAMQ